MNAVRLNLLWLLWVLVISLHMDTVCGAESTEGKQVLILNSFESHTPPYLLPKIIIRSKLQEQFNSPVSFREISLESNWGEQETRESLILETIDKLFTTPPLDLVIAMGPPATNFWLRNRDRMPEKIPFIALGGENRFPRSSFGQDDAAVVTALNFSDFIDGILAVRPDSSHILMIFGASPYGRSLAELAKSQLSHISNRINFEFSNDYSFTELLAVLQQLDGHSAVFFGQFNYDATGLSVPQDAALRLVREASTVPVFGAIEEQLGHGIVGGRLIDQRGLGEAIAEIAATLLRQRGNEVIWEFVDLAEPKYDWRELQAFSIDHDLLPVNSVIEFEPVPLWVKYRYWTMLIVTVLLIQSLLIALLLLTRRNHKRAERARVNLSGMLINAHEEQRKAIARELHDDLSQRLTRLAIDATLIGAEQMKDQDSSGIDKLRKDIVEVSKDVHDMSYWLHPSILDDLGLQTALRTELEQISRHTDAELEVQISDLNNAITPDVALCTFRIAQEALQNAVNHANATRIELKLTQKGKNLELSVSDNGKGFRSMKDDDRIGIGLSSMRERARLLGCKLHVNSTPGRGTTVSVTIPSDGVNP